MATSFTKVYDAFLGRINADDWTTEEEYAIVERDWQELLKAAIGRFKYPRIALDYEEIPTEEQDEDTVPDKLPIPFTRYQFVKDLTNSEIQVLAVLMKHEWVKRCIATYDHIKTLYTDKDFSEANLLDKLNKMEARVLAETISAQDAYDKASKHTPDPLFRKLAGKKNALK